MTRQRIVLLLLAIVLVYAGTIFITQIPFKRIYQGITNPKADAEDVSEQLQSNDALTRRQGLDDYHYGLQDDSELMDSLVKAVLSDPDEANRLQAIKILTGKTSAHLTQLKKQAPLRVSSIDQIVELISQQDISEDMFWALIQFAANTSQWQSAPAPVIKQLSVKLSETSPVTGEERYASYKRADKHRSVLLALKGYARYMMLPAQTLETLLPLYTSGPTSRLRPQVGYIYQYHAINGPLPPSIRQAVVDTMQHGDAQNMRQTAIMTMEWIGKQEGQIPPEMIDTLHENADDSWTQKKMSHVIIRMQKHFVDPLASLLAVARNPAIPDSIRANALREAGKNHSQDQRYTTAVKHIYNSDVTALRAAAIQLLPDTTEQRNTTLAMIDNSLKDTDPGIRILALMKLSTLQLPDSEKILRLEQALADEDASVIGRAYEIIKDSGLSSKAIEERITRLIESGRLQLPEEKSSPGLWKTVVDTVTDTRKHGLRLYWLLAATSIAVAAIFAIYYVYRLLITVQQRNRRAYTILGVLLVWVLLSYGMAALFFFGAFMFGHNSLVAPKAQFTIDAIAGAALFIYVLLGWLMGKLVNRPR